MQTLRLNPRLKNAATKVIAVYIYIYIYSIVYCVKKYARMIIELTIEPFSSSADYNTAEPVAATYH